MITSKKHLEFYILADRMMNTGSFKLSIGQRIKSLFGMTPILSFLKELRKVEYWDYRLSHSTPPQHIIYLIFRSIHKMRHSKLGRKCGFTIYPGVVDYGMSIPHWGTIVVGPRNRIGRYALFHTSVCIPGGNRTIGDFLYMSAGSKITGKDITLGDCITVASNSVCTKTVEESNVLLAGMPAMVKAPMQRWTDRDGAEFARRVEEIEKLKKEMEIE